jgi:hypothetical protein
MGREAQCSRHGYRVNCHPLGEDSDLKALKFRPQIARPKESDMPSCLTRAPALINARNSVAYADLFTFFHDDDARLMVARGATAKSL